MSAVSEPEQFVPVHCMLDMQLRIATVVSVPSVATCPQPSECVSWSLLQPSASRALGYPSSACPY